MDSKFIWNFIVDQYKKDFHKEEKVVQDKWEKILSELFGYRALFGEIEPQPSLFIGAGQRAIPDIVVKSDGEILFDLELKQYNLPLDIQMEEQLKSYLKLLETSVGVLICRKMYIYIYADKQIKRIDIDIIEDNPDGIKFVELFRKGCFCREDIEEFIDLKTIFRVNVEKIKKEFAYKEISEEDKEYLQEIYSVDEIETAIKEIPKVVVAEELKVEYSPQKITYAGEYNDEVIYEEPDFEYVIIKTSDKMVEKRGSLYDATRRLWKAGEKITRYSFALSVINKVVQEVYIIDSWNWIPDIARWEFFGKEARGPQFEKLIGKTIPQKYRKKGMASPIVYKNYDCQK